MDTVRILLNETIYRTKTCYQKDNTFTRYATWGIYEYVKEDNERILSRLIDLEDATEEVCAATLKPDQVQDVLKKGYWQCSHNGAKCEKVAV